MSPAAVRHHLGILASDGRVVADSAARTPGRGRPVKLYRLSDSMRGDNLAVLSDIVLQQWLSGPALPDAQAGVKSIAGGLRDRMGVIDEKLPATKRLEQLVKKLDDWHYEARWEAGAEGPRIIFGRCPYAEIIDQHPELCAVDASLLGGVMNAEAEQRSKIRRQIGEPDRCVFALSRPAKKRD